MSATSRATHMLSAHDIIELPVVDARDRDAGMVEHVLFHPQAPTVVGFQIRPPRLAHLIARKPRFVPLGQVQILEGRLRYTSAKPDTRLQAEKKQGFTWDDSVVWRMMPVVSESGQALGLVKDVLFSASEGKVQEVFLTGGLAADIAVGTQRLSGEMVIGFDRGKEAIVARDVALSVELSGGVAAKSGRAAAVAKVTAGKVARKAAKTAVDLTDKASKHDLVKETVKRGSSGWKAFRDGFSEGMREKD